MSSLISWTITEMCNTFHKWLKMFTLQLDYVNYFCVSLRFNGHIPGEPGLAGVYWSKGWWRWWWQLDYWTTGAISCVKLWSDHRHQQTDTQFFYRPDALPAAQPTVSKHWRENIRFHGLAYPKLTWGSFTLSLTTDHSWLPWGGLPCLSSALWCQYPNVSYFCVFFAFVCRSRTQLSAYLTDQ